MVLERVIEILEKHQEWRRDQNVPAKTEMQSPIEIGTAIDYALSELKKLRLGDVVGRSEQLVAFLEFVDGYKMLEVDLDYEEIVRRFLSN